MLTLTIVSSVATSITINGTVVALTAGTNSVTVFYTESSGASISIQLGVDGTGSDVDEISLTISGINWYAQEATSGDESGDEEETKEYEVSGDAIYPSYSNTLTNTEEGKADDTWIYWYVQDTSWGCGSVVTMTAATLADDTITLTYSGGSETYSVQLFYTNTSLTSGNYYMLTCTVYASVACTVTINGKSVELAVGENTVTVDFTLGEISAFDMQMAGTDTETTIKVSNVAWYNLVEKDTSTDDESGDADEDEDQSGATLEATFLQLYGATWLEVQVVTEIDLTSSDYTVYYNGSEATGKNIYYYGDSSNNTINIQIQISTETLTEVPSTNVITFKDADGNVVATVTYTPATSGDEDTDEDEDQGDSSSSGVTLEATLVQSLYGQTWFEVQVVTEIDLTSSAYTVYYNGSVATGKNIYYFGDSSNNTINIQIQISTKALTEIPSTNVITFVDADGNTVATVNYTPAA